MVNVRVCSKLKTSWKSVVFTNKVSKNSRYFVGVLNKTIIPLALVVHEMIMTISNDDDDYFEKGCRKKNVHATIPKGNIPQYLSGLSRALFPTTFPKKAVSNAHSWNNCSTEVNIYLITSWTKLPLNNRQLSKALKFNNQPSKLPPHWDSRLFLDTFKTIPWVPETSLARFPVSAKSL